MLLVKQKKIKSAKSGKHLVKAVCLAVGITIFAPSLFAAKATLNLKDTDIEVFIESVSRITGKTFIIDPRVRNKKVTVISQHEMDEDAIFALFLSVLRVHQFSAVETDGIYKIEQLQAAKQDSVPVYSENNRNFSGDQLVTRVIKVDNVDVGQLVPLLRTLVSTQGLMSQYKPTNVMVIHDTAANLSRIVKIIRQIDKESNEDIQVIPLRYASATEVVRILESLEKQSGQSKSPSANKPRFVADERMNSILLSADKKASLRLRALIARLDSEIDNNGNTKVKYLHYASAEELATLLEGVGESIEQKSGKEKGKARRPGNTKAYSIKAHKETNSLVITAAPDIMRSFESVINQLDIPRKQVHVEAIIVEVSESAAKELGVQWATEAGGVVNFTNTGPSLGQVGAGVLAYRGRDQGSTTTIVDGNQVKEDKPDSGDNGAALGGIIGSVSGALFGYLSSDKSWAALVKALATDTDSNVLSTPSLTTLDNEEASISIGQEIPIITGSTLGDNNSNPFQQIQRKDVGISLKITPQINEGDAVRLNIEQEVSSIAGATGADIVTNKRQIKTAVLVGNGQTIVLGGLIDDDIQESTQKVPLLGDLPIIGSLFSSKKTTKSKKKLMVFIRPVIIDSANGLNRITSRKYNYIRAEQLSRQQRGINLMPATDSAVLPEWSSQLSLPPSFEKTLKDFDIKVDSNKESAKQGSNDVPVLKAGLASSSVREVQNEQESDDQDDDDDE